jgi:hypothetical protein
MHVMYISHSEINDLFPIYLQLIDLIVDTNVVRIILLLLICIFFAELCCSLLCTVSCKIFGYSVALYLILYTQLQRSY